VRALGGVGARELVLAAQDALRLLDELLVRLARGRGVGADVGLGLGLEA
jgi:hypothetical protein